MVHNGTEFLLTIGIRGGNMHSLLTSALALDAEEESYYDCQGRTDNVLPWYIHANVCKQMLVSLFSPPNFNQSVFKIA